jgi:isopentenyl-diphosphate Delta-isomerase
MNPRVVIVDEGDNVIGHRTYAELDSSDIDKIYRVSALWLNNSSGEILLSQRGLSEAHNPGCWGPAVAGTIEEGDTYISNIIKEAKEELGLEGIDFKKGPKRRVSEKYNYFCQWYTAVVDKPAKDFVIQKEEVAAVRWISREELAHELGEHPENFLDLSWPLASL